MSRVEIGDVFQVLTSLGVCYGQVINKHPKWKFIIAIYREFYDQEPTSFTDAVSGDPQFVTTFLLGEAVQQGLFKVVGRCAVQPSLADFPTFRATNSLNGAKTMWFFWDGTREWRATSELSDEEKRYPRGPSLPSAPLLIEMIEQDYRVEKDYI